MNVVNLIFSVLWKSLYLMTASKLCSTSSSVLCSKLMSTRIRDFSLNFFSDWPAWKLSVATFIWPSSCKTFVEIINNRNHICAPGNARKLNVDVCAESITFVFFVLWNNSSSFLFVPMWISFTLKILHSSRIKSNSESPWSTLTRQNIQQLIIIISFHKIENVFLPHVQNK